MRKIEVLKFEVEHLKDLNEQHATARHRIYVRPEQLQFVAMNSRFAYTVKVNSRTVLCAGVLEYWPGRGEAWALFDESCRHEFISVHNVVKRFLKMCPVRRIEAMVDLDFPQGHKWISALGFQLEAPRMKAYRQDGGDVALYALVREELG